MWRWQKEKYLSVELNTEGESLTHSTGVKTESGEFPYLL